MSRGIDKAKGKQVPVDGDPFLTDMALGMAKMGLVAESVDDTWRVTTVEIVRGVEADVPIPIVPVVEMLTADVWEMTWEAAKSVAPMVWDHFYDDIFKEMGFHTRNYLDWVAPCNSGHVVEDVHVRVMWMLLEAQGWTFFTIPGGCGRLGLERGQRARSPAWLYPPSEVPSGVVRKFVRERMPKTLGGSR